MKRKIIVGIGFLLALLLLGSAVQGKAWPSKIYDAIMSSNFRPILDKDKKNILGNIELARENLANLPEECKDTELKELLTLKEQEVKDLSFKNFIYETNNLKKEIFFLNKKINSRHDQCQDSKENFSLTRQKKYVINENYFTAIIDLKDSESNNFIRIENIGKNSIKPRLIINGQDLTSLQSISESIINESMSDKEKALAIWNFVKNRKYHLSNPTTYVERDSIDLFQSWGYGNCGFTTRAIIDLATLESIPAREHRLGRHIVSELYFENDWHVLDGDGAIYYTKEDEKIASVEDIVNDLTLLEKFPSPVYSYEYLESAYQSREDNTIFPYQPRNIGKKVEYTLRPRESVLFLDSNGGDYFSAVDYSEPSEYSNSFFVYTPGKAEKIISFSYPYPFVGGAVEGESKSSMEIYFSTGRKWQKIYEGGAGKFYADYSELFNNGFGVPDQEYGLRFSTDEISDLKIITEVQASSRALPFLKEGVNSIEFINDLGTENIDENIEVLLQVGFN